MITYYFLPDVIDRIPPSRLERILLIVDEIHNIGSEQNVIKMNISENDKKYLTSDATDVPLTKPEFAGIMNQYKKFYYRLGLSATPFSDFDDERNQFIINSFMQHPVIINKTPDWKIKIIKEKKIFYFGLEDAIKKGILCPFEYIPLKYKPSVQDLEERKRVLKVWSLKVKNGEASPEAPYIMAANVLKASRNKIPVFKKYLNKCSKKILKRCIIFVQTTDYGKDICNLINGYTKDYHEFFSDDEKENLVEFGIGNLEVLITCHMISEGVDIKSVSNIVLFSSDRQQLETIQRIGRALRTDPSNPSKISKVIDFVYLEEDKSDSADKIRMEWLSYLAKIRPEGR
jgi:superfamily II DNA or RNA helicase